MENLNIVQLIEKNPIIRLSKDYEHKLLNKIKNNFTNNDHNLFVSSFYCFLNYDSKRDFVINLDTIWKWIGYTRKSDCKRVLEKHFIIDIDYKVEIVFRMLPENSKNGRPNEDIMLTINTFKKFCLKANTKKADEIHDYYIKLEDLLQETINEETDELREQLEAKDIKMIKLQRQNESLSKVVRRRKEEKNRSGKCLYIITTNEKENSFKIGSSINIDKRIETLNTSLTSKITLVNIYYTEWYVSLEETIKKVFSKYRITVSREFYDLKIIDRLREFIESYIKLYDLYKDCSEFDDIIIEIIENIEVDKCYNNKKCINCKDSLHLDNFFKTIDGKSRIETCIICYELTNKCIDKCKQCKNCNIIKYVYDFTIDNGSKDGLSYDCKACLQNFRHKLKENNITIEKSNIGKKQCVSCKKFEYRKLFFTTETENVYSNECKKCYCERNGDHKQCFKCKEIRIIIYFNKALQNIDGYSGSCKQCDKIKRDKNLKNRKEVLEDCIGKKQCIKCNEYMKNHVFFKNFMEDTNDFIYYHECRNCYTPNSLQCTKCNNIKELENFGKYNTKSTCRRTICKECTNIRDRKRRLENTAKRELVIVRPSQS